MICHYESGQADRRHSRFNAVAVIASAILLASMLNGCERDRITGPELEDPAAGQGKVCVPTLKVEAWLAAVHDTDGDGYADIDALDGERSSVRVHADYPLTIPAGYVTKKGDLDDDDENVHPRQPEVYGNELDDDQFEQATDDLAHYLYLNTEIGSAHA